MFDDKWFERLSDQQLGRIWRRALQITLQRREERLEEMRERYERAEGPEEIADALRDRTTPEEQAEFRIQAWAQIWWWTQCAKDEERDAGD